jgi:hypothetical protein
MVSEVDRWLPAALPNGGRSGSARDRNSGDRVPAFTARQSRRGLAAFTGRTGDRGVSGEAEIADFLTELALTGHLVAGTQNQAISALSLLYDKVIGRELGFINSLRAKASVYLPVVLTKSICPMHWRGSTLAPVVIFDGSTFFRHVNEAVIREVMRSAGITFTRARSARHSSKRCTRRKSQSWPFPTLCATVSQRTVWKTGLTSGRCKNCWATKMLRQPRSTLT